MLVRILDQEATSIKGYGTKFLMLVTWGSFVLLCFRRFAITATGAWHANTKILTQPVAATHVMRSSYKKDL